MLLLRIYETRQKHYSYYKFVKGKRERDEKREQKINLTLQIINIKIIGAALFD